MRQEKVELTLLADLAVICASDVTVLPFATSLALHSSINSADLTLVKDLQSSLRRRNPIKAVAVFTVQKLFKHLPRPHSSHRAAPVLFRNLPIGHLVQEVAPGAGEYVPEVLLMSLQLFNTR